MKFLVLFLLFCASTLTAHKTVILISPPRSLSTVFLRMMAARGDFTIFNEPGLATFHKLHNRTSCSATNFRDDTPSFVDVQNSLITAQQHNNIFVKEMFHAAREYLTDHAFLASSDCYFVFLVRNPHHAAISNVKKWYAVTGTHQPLWDFKSSCPEFFSYQSLYSLYQQICAIAANRPYVIIAEDLIANPHTVLTKFCAHLDIPITEKCLSWEALDKDFSFQVNWHDSKEPTASLAWHDHAIASTHFNMLSSYKTDKIGAPTFEEITDPELRGAHRWEYYSNRVFYDKFVEESVNYYGHETRP